MRENKKLKIAIDSSILLSSFYNNSNRTGIYFVAYNIAKQLLNRKEVDLYFYVDENINSELIEYLNNIFPNNNIQRITKNSKIWLYIDIFYSPALAIPNFIINLKYIKTYITIHDLIPYIFPQYYPDYDENSWHNIAIEQSIKNNYCFTISENTKNDLLKYRLNFNPNNITTIYNGIDNKFEPKNSNIENILKKYNIPQNKKYIFSLCTIESRKNLIRIIRTFFRFIEKNNIRDTVFIMGGSSWENFIEKFTAEIEEYKDRIIRIGYVADEDLPYLYGEAQWFVYTSQYEGFGLPPLEAMACGCPVIVSNNSSLPEVVGDAGIMIDYDSDKQHIEAYERYYFNEEYRKEMAQKGLERSKLFSWEKCVGEMLKIMRNNIDRSNKPKLIKTEDLIYYRIFGLILTLPRLRSLFSVRKSEDNRFTILTIFGIRLSIKNKYFLR